MRLLSIRTRPLFAKLLRRFHVCCCDGLVNSFLEGIDEISSHRLSLQQGKTTPERFETQTTVNTRTTDTIQRNPRSNTRASFPDLSLSKNKVATESLVSTLDNVTFSVKNFEYRVHEHFLW